MEDKYFDVVFSGQFLTPNKDKIKQDFSRLFKITEQQVDKIFAANRTVLKKSINEKTALQYQRRLGEIGVLVTLVECKDPIDAVITLEPEEDSADKDLPPSIFRDAEVKDTNIAVAEQQENRAQKEKSSSPSIDRQTLSLQDDQGTAPAATIFARGDDVSKVNRLSFEFTGNGAEYFKIWIVNIFLSIVTLGIYSAWAKVRSHQYFYGNTRLNNSAFEYLASPITILKGRVIAVILFAIYTLVQKINPLLSAGLFFVFIVALPWLVMLSLRFRMRNTAYRNIRFGFDGALFEAAKSYTLMFLLLPFTLGLLLPYMLFLQNSYFINNARYGVDGFSYSAAPRDYYRIYFRAFLAFLAVAVVAMVALAIMPLLSSLVMLVGYLLVVTYLQVELMNLMFDNLHLGDHQFYSSLAMVPYFKLYLFNTIGMVVTLGLYYPWAKVRIARYRAKHLLLISQGSLDHYVASQQNEVNALGEEVGDIFDVDLVF
jgi:uncharacterized membrane protein YjgN (DUF898 family)